MSRKQIEKRRQAQKKKQNIQVAAGAIAVILIAALVLPSLGGIAPEINVQEAYQKRAEGAFILDVREQYEWDEKHIPGATLIPLGELAYRLDEIPADQEIVVVCRSGNRSQDGRDILLNAGFENVTSMAGGINEWINQGYEAEFGQ